MHTYDQAVGYRRRALVSMLARQLDARDCDDATLMALFGGLEELPIDPQARRELSSRVSAEIVARNLAAKDESDRYPVSDDPRDGVASALDIAANAQQARDRAVDARLEPLRGHSSDPDTSRARATGLLRRAQALRGDAWNRYVEAMRLADGGPMWATQTAAAQSLSQHA